MTSSSDQNLLFGIIALHMDFVRREQLVAATSMWLTDKARQIEQVLVEQGAMSEEDRQLLAPLVARHLENHDGDPQQSLASLSSIDSVADELRSLGDENIEATLSMIASDRPNDHEETVLYESKALTAADAAARDAQDARFRILRSHAKGGLGEVYVAKDTELNREVALKEIQNKYADDEASRLRFLLEAEVTGGLEHPGIVPVYGLGRYDDGRPFYAMRFIKGDSLQEATDRFHERAKSESPNGPSSHAADFGGLEFRKLVGRFIDVCHAIEYAHSRGVLHRDLKPGNIMLGKYGETLVVDWGLAKAQGREATSGEGETTLRPASASGSAPTMMGSAIGTPAFMPPEQAAGELDKLGPASDVYSLGATLYYMLTGQPPVMGDDLGLLLKRVQQGDFLPPRAINAGASKPLNAICLRAMATRPQDRYSRPQELAEDVERYLADEPVTAYNEPFMNRAVRWVRKHQTFSVTTAAVVLLSAIGLGVLSTIVSTKNAELSAANTREIEARKLAEANEQSAREQGQFALTMVASVINDIQNGMEKLAGSGEIRRNLLRTSISKLESLSSRYVAKAKVDFQTIRAFLELGDVVLEFGSEGIDAAPVRANGSPVSKEQQSAVRLAETFYRRAHEMAEQLAADDPDSPGAQAIRATAYGKLGKVQLRSGQTRLALTSYRKRLEIAKRLAENHPRKLRVHWDLADSYESMGIAQLQLGQPADALESYRQSLEIREKSVADHPDSAELQRRLSSSYTGMGDAQMAMGQSGDALTHYRKALEINEQLAAGDPDNTNAQQFLINSRFALANLQLEAGQANEALTLYEKALETAGDLAEHDSGSYIAQQYLSLSYNGIGDVQKRLDQTENALKSYQKSLAFIEKAAAIDPDDQGAQQNLYAAYAKLGGVQLDLGQVEMALASFAYALETSKEAAQKDPSNAEKQRDLSASHALLGNAQLKARHVDEALASYQDAVAILGKLAADAPDDIRNHQTLIAAWSQVGTCQLVLGQNREGRTSMQRALEVARKWAQDDPTNATAQRALSVAHGKMGLAEQRLEDFDAAKSHFRSAIDILDKLIDDELIVGGATVSREYWSKMLLRLENTKVALGDWTALLQQPEEALPTLLDLRGVAFVKRAQFAKAAEAAAKLRTVPNATATQLYNASCVFSICAASIKADAGEELSAEKAKQHKQYIVEALASLKQAVEAGFDNFDLMQRDPDLVIIRDRPEFQALIPQSK